MPYFTIIDQGSLTGNRDRELVTIRSWVICTHPDRVFREYWDSLTFRENSSMCSLHSQLWKKILPSPARQIMTAENYPSKWRAVIVKLLFIFTIFQATIEICRPRVALVLGFLQNLVARTRSNGKGSFSLIFKCTAAGQFLDASEAVRVHDALNRQ